MAELKSRYAPAFIYVMKNTGFTQLKVGHTTRSVYERAQELSSATGVPGRFTVLEYWYVPRDAAKNLERRIHLLLKSRGKYFKKEFFNATHEEVRSAIAYVFSEHEITDISFVSGEDEREKLDQFEEFLAERSARFREIREKELQERRTRDEEQRAQLREKEILSEFDRLYWRALHRQNPLRLVVVPRIFTAIRLLVAISIFVGLISLVAGTHPPKDLGGWAIIIFFAWIFAYGGWDFFDSMEMKWHVGMLNSLKNQTNFERKRFVVLGDIEKGRLTGKTPEQLTELLTKYYL